MKLSTELKKLGIKGTSASTVSPCGTLSSSTMMVMMMAMTPSLKASSLALFILVPSCSKPLPPDDDGNDGGHKPSALDFPLSLYATPREVNVLAVSAKSYKGKIPPRTGRPAFSYIRTAAAGSTVGGLSNIRGGRHAEQHSKTGNHAKAR